MNKRILTTSLMTSLLIAGLAMPAFAHAHLQQASPAGGDTLATAPKQIALSFSEQLEPTFSGVAVTDADGHDVEAAKPAIGDTSMTVALKPLSPGVYHVNWHAVAIDTHRTEGTYIFTVKP